VILWIIRSGGITPVAQAQDRAPAGTVLRAYPVTGGDATETARRIQEEFGGSARAAFDRRTNQILVQAPAGLQPQIAQRIAAAVPPTGGNIPAAVPSLAGGPAATPAASVRPAARPAEAGLPLRSISVQLRNRGPQQLEGTLSAVFGARLTTIPTETGRVHRVALPGGGAAQLTIDLARGTVTIVGPGAAVDAMAGLIGVWDSPGEGGNQTTATRLVSLQRASPESVRRAAGALGSRRVSTGPAAEMVAQLFQPAAAGAGPAAAPAQPRAAAPQAQPRTATPPAGEGDLVGSVQIEMLEGLDVLVIRGHQRDVDRVLKIVEQIEQLSVETEPSIEVYPLQCVDCQALAELIRPLYDEIFLPRQGSVSITALVKPNALLLIGRPENVQTVVDLVKQLDKPVPPETEFRVFRLRHAAASVVQSTIMEFYGERGGLGMKVLVAADLRSNALIVQARPRDMDEVEKLIARIDTPTSATVNELRLFPLENSLATELAPVLQQAIVGQATGAGGAAAGQAAARTAGQRTAVLRFHTIDAKGQKELQSGILSDVQITADARSNALLVSAPSNSMDLVAALIRQLDQLPAAEAQIKVFTIVNGDAAELVTMLETLFARETTGGQVPTRTGVAEGESSLVALRFAVDPRTNSIIASGSMGDLQVVEAILLRLDESDVRNRKSTVYRLKNAPAADVANAINEFLRSERQVQQLNPSLTSPFEQIEREVVVVPEPVSNSLIVSATPRYYEEITKLVEKLDERPPMVMIQVLIAEVQLNDTDEFGVELGLQDQILFDRSILDDIQTITQTETVETTQVSQQRIVSATNQPGFNFNNLPLGNSGADKALTRSKIVAPQGLSHFSVGRTNEQLGFGGLVLSASSESVSILVRALKACHRLEVLSRPQVMTLDNQPAYIQVGQRVPRITGMQTNQTGQTNTITMDNVGLILGVTPRISPDGLVVMEIDAEKSEVGPVEDGIPVAVSEGVEIKSPRIDTTTAQTTISASSGQTVVLGGLISKSKSEFHRKVPCLGDLPVLGHLFRYDGVETKRRELLIIMTPHIVRNETEAESLKQMEVSRLNWCLADVIALQGEGNLRRRSDEWPDAETKVVYPDLDPGGDALTAPEGAIMEPEVVPTPQALPPGRGEVPAVDDSSQRRQAFSTGEVQRAVYQAPQQPIVYGSAGGYVAPPARPIPLSHQQPQPGMPIYR